MRTPPHDAACPPARRSPRITVARAALALPYLLFAGAGIWWAQRSPGGRVPARFDWTLQPDDVARALTKVPHIQWMAVTFLLALLAVGAGRAGVAALMTFAVGIGWEIAELTVRAHHARLVDLTPDLAGIAVGYLLLRLGRWALPIVGERAGIGRLARSSR